MSNVEYAKIGKCEDRVIEECGELIQAICKAKRFGLTKHHPQRSVHFTNLKHILAEIEDVQNILKEYARELLP